MTLPCKTRPLKWPTTAA
jgi:Dehydrogenases with different specificities (related to short-chain alcohol dehydrogenases)